MVVYKITDKDGYTRKGESGETLWGENVKHVIKNKGNSLCSDQVIHCYKDPYLAAFMNPVHGDYDSKSMLLWESEVPEIVDDDGTKSGCKTLTTIKQIPVPELTTDQWVEIAIRCAMKVYRNDKFQEWALNWITNKNRSVAAAEAAAEAAWAAAEAAAWATEAAAWTAARAAAEAAEAAAEAAAWAAKAAEAAAWTAARAAAEAAEAAAWAAARAAANAAEAAAWTAARAAAEAAAEAAWAAAGFDLVAIIKEVVNRTGKE